MTTQGSNLQGPRFNGDKVCILGVYGTFVSHSSVYCGWFFKCIVSSVHMDMIEEYVNSDDPLTDW